MQNSKSILAVQDHLYSVKTLRQTYCPGIFHSYRTWESILVEMLHHAYHFFLLNQFETYSQDKNEQCIVAVIKLRNVPFHRKK